MKIIEVYDTPDDTKGERQLLSAILDTVKSDLHATTASILVPAATEEAQQNQAMKLRRSARQYIMLRGKYPFGFDWVCEHLDLEPERVARLFLGLDNKPDMNVKS